MPFTGRSVSLHSRSHHRLGSSWNGVRNDRSGNGWKGMGAGGLTEAERLFRSCWNRSCLTSLIHGFCWLVSLNAVNGSVHPGSPRPQKERVREWSESEGSIAYMGFSRLRNRDESPLSAWNEACLGVAVSGSRVPVAPLNRVMWQTRDRWMGPFHDERKVIGSGTQWQGFQKLSLIFIIRILAGSVHLRSARLSLHSSLTQGSRGTDKW